MTILRIAKQLGMGELRSLAESNGDAAVVLGNIEQPLPLKGIVARQVVESRLENMARGCARTGSYTEVRISDSAKIANVVFGDGKVHSGVRTWYVAETEATRIQAGIDELNLDTVDRILVTSSVAQDFLTRRVPEGTVIDLEEPASGQEAGSTSADVSRISWVGSADLQDGLQDFFRIAALTDLPVRVMWSTIPTSAEFTATVAAMSVLGLEDRTEFAVPGTFEAFAEEARESADNGELWVCTVRDVPARSAYELLLSEGAPMLSFDSMYVRDLERRYPGAQILVSEGDVQSAAERIASLRKVNA